MKTKAYWKNLAEGRRLEMSEKALNHAHELRMARVEKQEALDGLKAALITEKRDLELENRTLKAQLEANKLRIDSLADPYNRLAEILKALVVKLPTMNIQSLSVTDKGKS